LWAAWSWATLTAHNSATIKIDKQYLIRMTLLGICEI
jgi:hypothetical protein